MSQENMEVIRRLYEAVNAAGLEVAVDFAHPDIEVVPPPNWPETSTVKGLERVLEVTRQWVETFESFRVEPERYLQAGERIVVYVRDTGRIRGSGAEIDTHLIHVWTLADCKVIRWELFSDEAQALDAAGLTA